MSFRLSEWRAGYGLQSIYVLIEIFQEIMLSTSIIAGPNIMPMTGTCASVSGRRHVLELHHNTVMLSFVNDFVENLT
jgi:hypothetical protein